jgi:D-beta-D-heptose 7-phosphate kinase/D-beta-D-heptose 1-phosphate adenosyltransferase
MEGNVSRDQAPRTGRGGAKLVRDEEAIPILEARRQEGRSIVFTNGCFDLLHAGHVCYLEEARALGDLLVVGINTDESVRGIKGPGRPINALEDRVLVLGGLSCVDMIIPFHEPDPHRLIARVRPHVLVKGADWAKGDIVGRDLVESMGGRVVTLPLREGISTTVIIERILRLHTSGED